MFTEPSRYKPGGRVPGSRAMTARSPYWDAPTPDPVAATLSIVSVPRPVLLNERKGRKGYVTAGPPWANRTLIWLMDGAAIGCVVTRIVTGIVSLALTPTLP